ncbi:MAG: hypothetical protein HY401_09530 [Elusimicrobia bacterium]|nr:hypothetical protein [Elusimicrobiota bacterium]
MRHLKVLASVVVLAGALGAANAQEQPKKSEDKEIERLKNFFDESEKGVPESQVETSMNQIPAGRSINALTSGAKGTKAGADKVFEEIVQKMVSKEPLQGTKVATDKVFENINTTVLFSEATYRNAATLSGRSSANPGFGQTGKSRAASFKADALRVAQIAAPIIGGLAGWHYARIWGKNAGLGGLLLPLVAGAGGLLGTLLLSSLFSGRLGKNLIGNIKHKSFLLGLLGGGAALAILKIIGIPVPLLGMAAIMLMSALKGSGQARAQKAAVKSREDMLIV